jgi:hypothetical protein
MNDLISDSVISKVRELYANDEDAQRLFDWAASRERDAAATSIERIMYVTETNRREAVELAKKLEAAGCGYFVVGRRGQRSRFEWSYSLIGLGQVAAGEATELSEVATTAVDADEDQDDEAPVGKAEVAKGLTLSIQEAKEAIARSLKVPVSSIEIIVRA